MADQLFTYNAINLVISYDIQTFSGFFEIPDIMCNKSYKYLCCYKTYNIKKIGNTI